MPVRNEDWGLRKRVGYCEECVSKEVNKERQNMISKNTSGKQKKRLVALRGYRTKECLEAKKDEGLRGATHT